jgi:hypothetical protein
MSLNNDIYSLITNNSSSNFGAIDNMDNRHERPVYDENITDSGTNSEEELRIDRNGFACMIYRYKFTEEFMEELYNFSKIHQYDERKDFKEAWKVWTEDNTDIIDEEMNRLLLLGYDGDILLKMFKSARYYFRKKSSEKKEPKQRRQYISVNRELLDVMDHHIEENIHKDDYQPKTAFVAFCKENEAILKETISKIFAQGVKDSKVIEDKIKKTYKNRYFILTSKN